MLKELCKKTKTPVLSMKQIKCQLYDDSTECTILPIQLFYTT